MPSYVLYALSAYLLLALHGVADKFMLTNTAKHPVVYTFYAGTSSIFVFILAPFGLKMLPFNDFLLALLSGAGFLYATYFLYKAIQLSSVSRILPIEGGLVPLFTYIFAYIFLDERLTLNQSIAFLLLTSGAVIMSLRSEGGEWKFKALRDATIAAVLFAGSLVLIKHVYDVGGLVSGLVWSRLGLFGAAMLYLAVPSYRKLIFNAPKTTNAKNASLFYGTRAVGAAAGLLQNYAISIGSVVIVNALQGFQFIFVLFLTSVLSQYYPRILHERINLQTVMVKISAIVLITTGLALLGL
ncbi:MAG TPA: EamA family transporter [Candidatus Binatia bacterium]|nr:EamA family transporter [Candidatus Binatia bacterium]